MDSDENNLGLYNLVQNVWEYYKYRLLHLSLGPGEKLKSSIDDDVFGEFIFYRTYYKNTDNVNVCSFI